VPVIPATARAGWPAIVLRKRIEHSITTGHHGSGLRSFR
jgi:hypothetical protein